MADKMVSSIFNNLGKEEVPKETPDGIPDPVVIETGVQKGQMIKDFFDSKVDVENPGKPSVEVAESDEERADTEKLKDDFHRKMFGNSSLPGKVEDDTMLFDTRMDLWVDDLAMEAVSDDNLDQIDLIVNDIIRSKIDSDEKGWKDFKEASQGILENLDVMIEAVDNGEYDEEFYGKRYGKGSVVAIILQAFQSAVNYYIHNSLKQIKKGRRIDMAGKSVVRKRRPRVLNTKRVPLKRPDRPVRDKASRGTRLKERTHLRDKKVEDGFDADELYFDIEGVLLSYLGTMLWSTVDDYEEDTMLEDEYTIYNIDKRSEAKAKKDIEEFGKLLAKEGLLVTEILRETGNNDGQFGHDFWLTRNGHGAGFWDGDWGEYGDILTKIAEKFGDVEAFAQDGKVFFDSRKTDKASTATVKCPKCGKKILKAVGKCMSCGHKLKKEKKKDTAIHRQPLKRPSKRIDRELPKRNGRSSEGEAEGVQEYLNSVQVDVIGKFNEVMEEVDRDEYDEPDILLYSKASDFYNDSADFNAFHEKCKKEFGISDKEINTMYDKFDKLIQAYEDQMRK